MNKYQLPYFGEIDLDSTKDYYDTDIESEGQTIQVDLNIESYMVSEEKIVFAKILLENLSVFKIRSQAYILADYNNNGTVKDYISHHLGDIDEGELELILKNQDPNLSREKQMFNAIFLKRIGIYLDDDDEFSIFDYTIDPEFTQYRIVLRYKENGELEYLTMES